VEPRLKLREPSLYSYHKLYEDGFLFVMKKHAILLLTCPDKRGIVAQVSQFLYTHGANIVEASEYRDYNKALFCMRVEWSMSSSSLSIKEFRKKFLPIAKEYKMKWRMTLKDSRLRVVIFVSKEDHCLADLLYRYQKKELLCNVALVISNHENCEKLVNFYNIPFYNISLNNRRRKEKQILKLLQQFEIELIVLARYMQILSPYFANQYKERIINIHHSFLPAFKGAKPYHQAYARGVKIIGATSHYVTDALDEGPIIEQDIVRISHKDSVADMKRKGRDLERVVLSRAIRWHIENRILTYGHKTVIFD